MIRETYISQQWWRGRFIAGLLSPTLLLLATLFSTCSNSQVIYDFSEINSDVLIIGHSGNDTISEIAIFDLNDNGQNDLFVGGFDTQGRVYGFFDQPLHHGMVIDLMDEEADLEIYGDLGLSVGYKLIRCDINADGVGDLAVSGRHEEAVYIFFGSAQWATGTEINLSQESADITFINSYGLGCDMTSSDLNGDGLEDLVIGAERAVNPIGWSTGGVYVFFAGPQYASPMTIDLALSPADLTIFGVSYQDNFGFSLATGDVNSDNREDLIVGAYDAEYNTDKLGRTYVFFGSGNWPAHHVIDLQTQTADVEIIGPQWASGLGMSVASGDINGDGIDDILTGAPLYDGPPQAMGACYAIYGRASFKAGERIDLGAESANLTCLGEGYDNFLGVGMGTGDLDSDGLDDWAIAAANYIDKFTTTGRGFVIAGSSSFPAQQTIEFSTHQPTLKVLSEAEGDQLMLYMKFLTDVNGDKIADLILASPLADMPGRRDCGKIHIIFGHAPLNAPPRVLAGPGPHPANRAEVRLYDPFDNDQWLLRLTPYLVRGYGAVTATADLDGEGYDRMIAGPGPGPFHPPMVTIFRDDGSLDASFLAYGTPRYGVNVTAGDIDGNGRDEIITGAGPGEVFGPHVRAWRYAAGSVTPMPEVNFMAYGTLRWGVNVASGDLDGDGKAEIVTGAGPSAVFGPHVRAWRLGAGKVRPVPQVSFLAYGTHKYGVRVACGDIDGDGMDEIVTGPGPSAIFGSHVRGWNYDGQALAPMSDVSYFAYPESLLLGGVVVACGDIDNDGNDEILTTPGPLASNPPWLKSWNHDGDAISLNENKSFMVFGEGAFVAGANVALGNFFEPADYLK